MGQRGNGGRCPACLTAAISSIRSSLAADDPCARLHHAGAFARGPTSDRTDARFWSIPLHVCCGLFLCRAADLAGQDDRVAVALEQFRRVDMACAWNWVATDADASRLSLPSVRDLRNGIAQQRTTARRG